MSGDAPRLYSGWGRSPWSVGTAVPVTTPAEVQKALAAAPRRGLIARGLGRAYGDPAQNAGGHVIECTPLNGLLDLDLRDGTATVAAGTSLDQLMAWLVPLGWFVPVTPGTRQVTVGGAIAADIHGKNHHLDGTFGANLCEVTLALPDGSLVEVGPDHQADLFWATCGGMGLTGVIVSATVRLHRIETSRLRVDTDRAPDLDSVLALMDDGDDDYRYSVAWIDLVAQGASMGRSVLTRGDFAALDDLPAGEAPLAFTPLGGLRAPPVIPPHLLNPVTIRAFNELWYRKAPRRRRDELQTIGAFFHPLDMMEDWNRLYGRRGFLQWQAVIPFGEEPVLRRIIEELSARGCSSFLAVLKRFGPANAGPLSFPMPGWTLSLDIPAGQRGLSPLLNRLDDWVADAGGRLYLAKDSRMRPELLARTYPRIDEWRSVRARVDPDRVLQSDLSRRLGL